MKKCKFTRLIALFSCCFLLLTMLPAAAFAAPEGSWSDYAAQGFSGGDGSQAAPYEIATGEELAYLAVLTDTQGKFFRLTANVDLSAHVWQPIGSTTAFGGYFDGNGMTVSGLQGALFATITAPEANAAPLVQDLTISGSVTSGDAGVSKYTGLLAGSVNGVSGSQAAVISNVSVSGTVSTAGGYNTARGGMIGFAQNVTITGCSANVTIDALDGSLGRSLGALVGELSNGTISGCVTYGSVHGSNSIGGMVGLMKNGSTAVSSTANASVRSNSSEVGGFVGTLNVGCSVTDSIATGDVSHYNSKTSPYEGGFAGRNNGTITHCAAFGTVTEEADRGHPAGGFVGYADLKGVTQDCYYDKEKNPQWEAIGSAVNNGSGLTNDITPSQDACVDYFGEHNTQLVGAVPPTETTPGYTGDEVCMVCHKTITQGTEIPVVVVPKIYVNGQDIAHAENHTVTCGAGTAVYDPEAGTLTFTNATIDQANLSGRGVDIPRDCPLDIVLVGENTISVPYQGFFSFSDVTFRGEGSLTVESQNSCTLYVNGNITVDGATLICRAPADSAIQADGSGSFHAINGARVEAQGMNHGIFAVGDVKIAQGSQVVAETTAEKTNAITAWAEVEISDSQVSASSYYPAVYGAQGIAITGSQVDATATADCAIYSPASISVAESILYLTVPQDYYAVYSDGTCAVTGSWVEVTGGVLDTQGVSDSVYFAGETGTAVGNPVIPGDVTVGEGKTLTIPQGATLTIPENTTLTNNGEVYGTVVKNGTVVCNHHFGGAADCQNQAQCALCGTGYGALAAHKAVKTEAKAPTCTEDGNIAYWYCSVCGKYFSDEACSQEITQEQTVVPAAGHKYENGVCTQCGAKDPDNQPPTEPSEPTETTPPTDPEGPAQTGSSTPVELLTLVLLLSAVSVTLIWEKRRSL